MNLYIRYFDSETLVHNAHDAIDFLAGIQEVGMNQRIADDIVAYYSSDMKFPKRYKVRPRVYFIMIKTDANTMQEFKEYRTRAAAAADTPADSSQAPMAPAAPGQPSEAKLAREREQQALMEALNAHHEGWYEGAFDFKRVITMPSSGKHEYRDCHFVVRCKASSPMHCYNRIVEYLKGCVDPRSQFPSAKGRNFCYRYLGKAK